MQTMRRKRALPGLLLGLALGAAAIADSLPPSHSDVSATVECKEIGRLKGEVGYEYEVTLKNNTQKKLIVEYSVLLIAGGTTKKTHKHSTLLIPSEKLTETHSDKMKESVWDEITRFRVEWSSSESK